MLGIILLIGVLVMGGSGGDGGPGVGVPGDNMGPIGNAPGSSPGIDFSGLGFQGGDPLGGVVADFDFSDISTEGVMGGFADTLGGISSGMSGLTGGPVGGSSMNPLTRAALQFAAQKGLAPVFGQMGKAGAMLGGTPLGGGVVNAAINAITNPPQTAEQAFAMFGSAIANAMTLGLLGIPATAEGDVSTMGFSGPDMVEPSVGGSPFDAIAAGLSQGAFSGAPPVEAPGESQAEAPAPMPEYSLSPQPFGWYGMKRVNMPWVSQRPGFSGNYGGMKRVDE